MLAKVGKIVDLPKEETAKIARVTDLKSHKNQPFFARAREGDVLIVYAKNRLAILFDLEGQKVINMNKITVIFPTPPLTP